MRSNDCNREFPHWTDPAFMSAGGMVRGALWLLCEIGEGNTFTKEQLRQAFPGSAQIDRRIRDLRSFGWVISSNTEDASLRPDEQRFVKAGVSVWKPEDRRRVAAKRITARERQAVFSADGYQCVACGISGGETYPDSTHETAVLGLSRQLAFQRPGGTVVNPPREEFMTLCRRCLAGSEEMRTEDVEQVLGRIAELRDDERHHLREWIRRGRRTHPPIDQIWISYNHLPAEAREHIRRVLE